MLFTVFVFNLFWLGKLVAVVRFELLRFCKGFPQFPLPWHSFVLHSKWGCLSDCLSDWMPGCLSTVLQLPAAGGTLLACHCPGTCCECSRCCCFLFYFVIAPGIGLRILKRKAIRNFATKEILQGYIFKLLKESWSKMNEWMVADSVVAKVMTSNSKEKMTLDEQPSNLKLNSFQNIINVNA